ncbi:unnamed protein product [Acanthocheilonema viteae]|uniref:R3H domain-containing protein n=1 Tax=Acanthocheilonema viteae TaxID=6277 RepID=A0A498S187_ACAVI|nr:unnamed protein product [Acanthocheilonema viteae]
MSSEKKTSGENGTSANELHDAHNVAQSNKPAKLTKQSGVDEEDLEKCSEKFKLNNEEIKETTAVRIQQMDNSNIYVTVFDNHSYLLFLVQRKPEVVYMAKFFSPPDHINLNVTPSTKPKALVRSHAFSGDDDSGVSARHTPTSHFLASRSTFSSSSFDSGHGHDYTDSTGINLLSFITCTLHKNSKDRHMLLQLEQHMTKLIKDSTRNSQKFPAMSSYNRMLVHRVAAFFGLDHNVDQNGTAVVVNKTSHTRLPDIDFLSLIQGDVYTDEPRRILRRDAQSYEEVGQSLGLGLICGRRARSFEVDDCLPADPTTLTVGCVLPTTTSLHMHLLHQQGSTSSTDASSTHFLESPGSCYTDHGYSDMPIMGVYTAPESNSSFNNTTHIFPWSSSESYTSLSAPSSLISPVMHNHLQPTMLTREVSIDKSTPLHRTLSTHSSLPEQRTPAIPEHLLHENAHFADEYGMDITASQQQTELVFATPPAYPDFVSNQYIVSPASEQTTYTVLPPYFRYAGPPTLSVQKLTHQVESLCATGYPEVVPASPQSYLVSPPPTQTIYPQQFLVSPQVSTVYSSQPYFLPVLQRNYVPNVANVQGTYPVSITRHPISSYECSSVQQRNLVDVVGITKSEPVFEDSTAVTQNENISN